MRNPSICLQPILIYQIASVILAQRSLSYFRQILTPESVQFLNSTSELTLFLPIDEAWDKINPYEKVYLESGYASDDVERIVNMHAVITEGVKWSDSFVGGLNRNNIFFPLAPLSH